MIPEDLLRQLLDRIRAVAMSYDDFCRRLGMTNCAAARDLWDCWQLFQEGADGLSGSDLARLLEDKRPWSADEILRNEG